MKEELWGITNGDEEMPTTGKSENDNTLNKWKIKDQKARATICLAILLALLSHVRACTTAQEVWIKLQETYEAKCASRKLFLWERFFNLRMSLEQSAEEFISQLDENVEQLECVGAKINEEIKTMKLLSSLPPKFNTLTVALKSVTDDLTSDFIKTRILQEENAQNAQNAQNEAEESAFISKMNVKNNNNNKNK